jgi:hypothetical protein
LSPRNSFCHIPRIFTQPFQLTFCLGHLPLDILDRFLADVCTPPPLERQSFSFGKSFILLSNFLKQPLMS